MSFVEAAALAVSAAVAGAINSVAGGGSLISFPAALAAGLPPLIANATNAVALTPASLASAYAYRDELRLDRAVLKLLLPAALAGGLAGSGLLLVTPQKLFDAIVPLLVLFATALLFLQNLRPPKVAEEGSAWRLPERPVITVLLQFLVGVYGGYFGAGMGIMMLALFTRIGGADIHRMNGVKSVLAAGINAIAAIAFVVAGKIHYGTAWIMALGGIAGGLFGAIGARRVRPEIVQWGVVAIGVILTAVLGYQRWGR